MALCHHSPALLGVTLIRHLGQGGWMPTRPWLPRGPLYSLEQGVETLTPRPNRVHHLFCVAHKPRLLQKSEEDYLLTLTLYENQISVFTNNCFIGTQPNPFIYYLWPFAHCNGQLELQQTIWLIKQVLFSTQPVGGKAVCHLL